MKERIEELLKQVKTLEASNHEELEALRIKYLSKKGEISALFNDFRNVANEEKKEIGKLLNELKNAAQDRINEIRAGFEAKESKGDSLDLTRTADSIALGTRHPISLVRNEIIDIFSHLGFTSGCSVAHAHFKRTITRNGTYTTSYPCSLSRTRLQK